MSDPRPLVFFGSGAFGVPVLSRLAGRRRKVGTPCNSSCGSRTPPYQASKCEEDTGLR